MLLTIVSLALAAVLAGPASAATAAAPRIVAFGDSLTSGQGIGAARAYPAILQQQLSKAGFDYTVVNAGVSGDTSAQALSRLDRALTGDVRILIVALGANDGLRGVPVSQLKSNLARIIQTAQGRNIQVLLCGMEALPLHGWDYSVQFHNVFRELTAQYNVMLVPFMLANVIGNSQLMLPDHVHPNADGARVIANNIWPYLTRIIAQDRQTTS
jgi:acyl-CoA thioesterase-1